MENVLETRLRRGRDGDRVAVTAKSCCDPEDVYFGNGCGGARHLITGHSSTSRSLSSGVAVQLKGATEFAGIGVWRGILGPC